MSSRIVEAIGVGLMLTALAGYAAIGGDDRVRLDAPIANPNTRAGQDLVDPRLLQELDESHQVPTKVLQFPPEPKPGCYLVEVKTNRTVQFLEFVHSGPACSTVHVRDCLPETTADGTWWCRTLGGDLK